MPTTEERKVDEIIWREDLYPRFKPNPAVIQQYAECIDLLPPIEINQRNELIDGYHRWTAHRKVQSETIQVIVTPTASDREFEMLAIRRNAQHGLQLSQEEKREKARRLYTGKDGEKDELAQLLSVSKRTVYDWLSRRDKDLKEERNRRIAELWLACYTEEEIAEKLGLKSRHVIDDILGELSQIADVQKRTIFSEYREPDWTPPLYNVWKRQEKTNAVSHSGNSEASFLDNLLYLYTEPFKIVVDPFAGGGATIDVCSKRLRRYWVSDRLPIIERTDIRQYDILDGPPPLHKRWQDVDLLYLDPPYWRQAEKEYSEDPSDLANMSLEDFYRHLCGFTTTCAAKMRPGAHIAMLMQPTQWRADDRRVVDHVLDICHRVNLKVEMRISIPYESQQCTAQQVQWAKDNRKVLILTREIIVWVV